MPQPAAPTMRQTFRLVASTAAATVLVLLAGLAAWRLYAEWRLGRVVLTNAGPPLTVQVLDESGERPIGEPVELIRRTTLALPPGDYRLHVAGEGRLSRTYRFAVNRGEAFTQPLTLDDCRLLGEATIDPTEAANRPRKDPIPFAPNTMAIELTPGKVDLVECTQTRLCRRDGATGEVIWDALEPPKPGKPARAYHPWVLWFAAYPFARIKPIDPAPDVDGDGTRDLIWATGSAFLAVSGKDGSVLWTYLAELDGPGGPHPEGPQLAGRIRRAHVVGVPSVADLDRDGVPDIVATLVFHAFDEEIARRLPGETPRQLRNAPGLSRRIVLAISGRSGKRLWSRAIDPAFRMVVRSLGVEPVTLLPGRDKPATFVPGREASTVAIVDGPAWLGLDPATGRPRSGPIDLGFEPVRPLQYADLDGDGEPEILAMGPGLVGKSQSLVASSIATGRPLWTATINARFEPLWGNTTQPDWPLVVDLDGDGRAEFVVPDSGPLDSKNGYRGACLLDGASGRPRWTRPMRPDTRSDDGLIHVVEAPDLDRDGVRDLVTTSWFLGRQDLSFRQRDPGEPNRIYVDALSGRDGRPLWWRHVERPVDRVTFARTPQWWGRGPDGWPLLAVPIEVAPAPSSSTSLSAPAFEPPTVSILEASTGRVVQTLTGINRAQVADLDGDGLVDLWGEYQDEHPGRLRAFRGEGPEVWRALGEFRPAGDGWGPSGREFQPGGDFDGDGIGDTLITALTAPGELPSQATGSRTAITRSGRDGRLIWKTDLGLRQGWFERDRDEHYALRTLPMPAGDLDGDGTPDVIVDERTWWRPPAQALQRPATLPLTLLSGRTGRTAWIAGPLPIEFEAHGYSSVSWIEPRVIEPNTAPDLLVRHNSPFLAASPTPPPQSTPTRSHLARVSGRTGQVLWDIPLPDRAMPDEDHSIPRPAFDDLDGDGALDILLFTHGSPGAPARLFDLKAVSLRDGRLLWSQQFEASFRSPPAIVTFDSDDPKRPLVAVLIGSSGGDERDESMVTIRTLDGRDGQLRWIWRGAEDPKHSREWTPPRWMEAARLEGDARRRACVSFAEAGGRRRIVVLDSDGRESLRRDLPGEDRNLIRAVDLDGDGRDELLVWHGGRLRAWGRGLEELWSWPDRPSWVASIVPASGVRAAMVLLPWGVGLDGKTGRPNWLAQRAPASEGSSATLLDPGDSARLPLLIANPPGLTIGRSALPTTPDGVPAPPVGDPVPPGRADGDPRWTRPLPWSGPILFTIGPRRFLAFAGLAGVNVAVPLAILWLAARRRPWTLRLLMALPVAAAVPLTVFQTVEPLIPAQIGSQPVSSRVVFALGTLAGVPIVALAGLIAWSLARRRWKALAWMAGLTVVTSAIIAAAWLWIDSRAMPAIEHYRRSEWYLIAVPGAYAVAVLLLAGWALRGLYRGILKLRSRRSRPIDAVPARSTM